MSEQKTPDISRRRFLGGAGTAVAGTAVMSVTPTVTFGATEARVPRWVMVMDLRRMHRM
jgi:hypothetical protein